MRGVPLTGSKSFIMSRKIVVAQQKDRLEWGMILVFWWQVETENINGYQEATGHQKVYHLEPGPTSDSHPVREWRMWHIN